MTRWNTNHSHNISIVVEMIHSTAKTCFGIRTPFKRLNKTPIKLNYKNLIHNYQKICVFQKLVLSLQRDYICERNLIGGK